MAGLLGATYYVYVRVPQAFLPEEDPGYFISIIQAPAGASLEFTTNVAKEAEKIMLATPEVASVFSVVGFSFAGSAPNQGLMFTLLKPFEERETPESRLQGLLPRAGGVAADYAGAIDVLEVLQGVLDDEALLALDCFK